MPRDDDASRRARSGSACWAPAAGWAPRSAGRSTPPTTSSWSRWSTQGDWLFNVSDAGAEVVVDFTTPDVVMDNLHWCIDQGINAVVGTTGFTRAAAATGCAAGWRTSPTSGWSSRPTSRIGAVLMMQFAARAARYFESVEIIEHAPPEQGRRPQRHGRAHRRADRRGPRRGRPRPGAGRHQGRGAGARGAPTSTGCGCTRSGPPGLVAHQEVLFGTAGETLTIRHDSYDRASFMPGVLLAVRVGAHRPGLTVGLDALLD